MKKDDIMNKEYLYIPVFTVNTKRRRMIS